MVAVAPSQLAAPGVEALATGSFEAPRAPKRLVHPRHHLRCHQLHGASRQAGICPVVSRVEERSERTNFVSESQDLLHDALRRARNDLRLEGLRQCNLPIRLIRVSAEEVQAA